MSKTFVVTLNWNTTESMKTMIEAVDRSMPEPHTWIVLDNGSNDQVKAISWLGERYQDSFGVFGTDRDGWGKPNVVMNCVAIRSSYNLGCVKGHNLCFDMAAEIADGEPYKIVMIDTDVEVYEPKYWLTRVEMWADLWGDAIGIVGLEHSKNEICAPAVFLDTHGNWYIHEDQTMAPNPCRAESVGLGFAVLFPSVVGLRFDEGYKMYYKQDDDLCFSVRFDLGLDCWAYPVDVWHRGAASLRENEYNVGDANGWDQFDKMKQDNQRYFARKWAFALRGRRIDIQAEQDHLREMKGVKRQ